MSADIILKIIWKNNEKILKQILCKTLKHCFNYERALALWFVLQFKATIGYNTYNITIGYSFSIVETAVCTLNL